MIDICGAKTRSGQPCRSAPMANGRCRMHGGTSLAGLASPTLKTGRYSRYLPERLSERYQESLADGELLALREEIALTDARLADLLKRVDTGESGALWQAARGALREFQAARTRADVPKMTEWLLVLETTIQKGASDYAAWGEIATVLEQRRRLVESERKRLVEMQQVITVEKAMVLIAALTDIVKRHVTDRDTRAAISAELIQLTARESSVFSG
jgi:hypothetical protein